MLSDVAHDRTYLRIRICRDRNKRIMELSMGSYIHKLGHDFHRNKARAVITHSNQRRSSCIDEPRTTYTALSISHWQAAVPSVAAEDRHRFRSQLPRPRDEQPD
jgi:hypothetical protein